MSLDGQSPGPPAEGGSQRGSRMTRDLPRLLLVGVGLITAVWVSFLLWAGWRLLVWLQG